MLNAQDETRLYDHGRTTDDDGEASAMVAEAFRAVLDGSGCASGLATARRVGGGQARETSK